MAGRLERGSVVRREAVCLYRMIPFTWHDKFSLQILRSLLSFSVDIRPFRLLACKVAVTLNRIKLKSFRVVCFVVCFVVCVAEISLSCNVITKSRVDTQILNLGANFNNNAKDSIIKLTRMWVDRHNSRRHATIFFLFLFLPAFLWMRLK